MLPHQEPLLAGLALCKDADQLWYHDNKYIDFGIMSQAIVTKSTIPRASSEQDHRSHLPKKLAYILELDNKLLPQPFESLGF